MKRLILLAVLVGLLQPADSTTGSEVSSFFTPYGFRTPLLKQGQYVLNFNPHYYRYESQIDATSGYLIHSKSVSKQYNFSLSGLYALTDKLIFQSNLILYPGQLRSTYWEVWNFPYDDLITESEMREHSNFTISPVVGVSFRPQANIEFFGDFHFSKEKSFYETKDEERYSDLKREQVYFNLGFTLLGSISDGKHTNPLDSKVYSFVRPYGFRAPVLSRGQYAVTLNSFYVRSESFSDYVSSPDWQKSVWRSYYFSLNGVYAATERLVFQSSLDIYPAQTRVTYDRTKVGTILNYDKMRSDFMISPHLTLSLRLKVSMELYGTFGFTREHLSKIREWDSQRDERNDIYYLSVGYTLLGNLSFRTSAPMGGWEFSDFFTPYGFRTPLLRQGQYTLSFGSYYERTESEEEYPSSTYEYDVRSTEKTYYFSLIGVYAMTNKLILEGSLSLYPNQTRMTQLYPWYDYHNDVVEERETKRRSNFAIFPRLEISFRPQRKMELYGSFYFNQEKSHYQEEGQKTSEIKNEGFILNLGCTILGDL